MKLSRRAALGMAAMAGGMSLVGCSSKSGGTSGGSGTGGKEVKVGIVQLPIFAPVYVAQSKGYFKDKGLTVNLNNVKSGQDAIPLAARGKLDAVAAGFSAGFFSSVNEGLDVRAVGSMGVAGPEKEKPASALVVAKKLHDSGAITSVADLKGKRVGASGGAGATGAFYISLALEQVGLSTKDVKLVNVSNPDIPTGIKTGSLDAAFVSAPFWSNAVEDGTAVKLWQTPPGTSGTGVLYGAKFITSDLAQPFFDAMARGAQDLQGDAKYSDENLKIIGDATGQTPEQVKSVPLYDWFPDLHPLPDQLAGMEKVWLELGALTYGKPIDPSKYVDTSFAKKVPAS